MRALMLSALCTLGLFGALVGFLLLPRDLQVALVLCGAGVFLVGGVFLGFYAMFSDIRKGGY